MLSKVLLTVFFAVSVVASYEVFSVLFKKPEVKQPIYVDYEKADTPMNITGIY